MEQQEHAGALNPKILHWPIITVCSEERVSISREGHWLCAEMIAGPAYRKLRLLFNSYNIGSQAYTRFDTDGSRERPIYYDIWKSPKRKPPCHIFFNWEWSPPSTGPVSHRASCLQTGTDTQDDKMLKGSLQHEGQRTEWKKKRTQKRPRSEDSWKSIICLETVIIITPMN